MIKRANGLMMVFLLALLSVLGIGGCGEKDTVRGTEVYYLNAETTRVVPEEYTPKESAPKAQIAEFFERLQGEPDQGDLQRTIPERVKVNGYNVVGYRLQVDFSEDYYEIDATREVLMRAAIVRTLMQVEGIAVVDFTVNGEALVNVQGQLVGGMNLDSFVENPGQQINSSQETILTLYFSNEGGDRLIRETRVIHYSSNISLEKLVMEQLIEGPKGRDGRATLPSDTKLITVSMVDGVCYVNLDSSISGKNTDITEEVLLYSIVNSLTELEGVDKVQISLDGDTKGKLRYVYDLSNLYEKDLSYMEDAEQTT